MADQEKINDRTTGKVTDKKIPDLHPSDVDSLRYQGFSIVLIQMFSLGNYREFDDKKAAATRIVSREEKRSVDHLIFVMDDDDRENMKRYKLQGFDFSLSLDDPYHLEMGGHVYVEMLVLFGYTVSLTYRFVFDGTICHLSDPAATDHIIALLSSHLSAEHWSRNEGEEETNINLELKDFKVWNLYIRPDGSSVYSSKDKSDKPAGWRDKFSAAFRKAAGRGAGEASATGKETASETVGPELESVLMSGCSRVFDELSGRYKSFIQESCTSYKKEISAEEKTLDEKQKKERKDNSYKDFHYAMVDIWEDVAHPDAEGNDMFANERADRMTEAEIVNHIRDTHKEELIGLMSLYPEEWVYRDKEAYDEVCGRNIAIDTDDLVLVNSNICVVIGTYGRRGAGSPVDWAEHLAERAEYHVSWPEYLFILEMVLARKYVIDYACDQLVDATLNSDKLSSSELIAHNAELSMRLSRMILQLNVVKYSKFTSHKVMFDRTTRRLDIENDQKRLIKLMEMVDNSLHNISDYKAVKSDFVLNVILAIISVVSTFEILFQDINLPFLEYFGLTSSRPAAIMVWFVAALAFFGLLLVIVKTVHSVYEYLERILSGKIGSKK